MNGLYNLTLCSYSGMTIPLIEAESLAKCRARAAKKIRYHRNRMEYPVSILERGKKWELETGDDAFMIGDGEGILKIDEVREPEPDDEFEDE